MALLGASGSAQQWHNLLDLHETRRPREENSDFYYQENQMPPLEARYYTFLAAAE